MVLRVGVSAEEAKNRAYSRHVRYILSYHGKKTEMINA